MFDSSLSSNFLAAPPVDEWCVPRFREANTQLGIRRGVCFSTKLRHKEDAFAKLSVFFSGGRVGPKDLRASFAIKHAETCLTAPSARTFWLRHRLTSGVFRGFAKRTHS